MTAVAQRSLAHLSLFNTPAYSALYGNGERYHRIDVDLGDRFAGSLAGVVADNAFVSGYGASFGGFDFLRERETLENVMQAVDAALAQVRGLGVARMAVRAKPFHYSRNEEYVHFALCRAGFAVSEVNLNFYFDLTRWGSAQAYRSSLRHAPDRQLRLALATDFVWREAAAPADWRTAYEVLAESRHRNGATLSLSLERVLAMRNTFGERVRMFVLERDAFCYAAVLLYAVTPAHAMVMYWGDREDRNVRGNGERPPVAVMNLVAFRTVETAFASGFQTIDLGPVSTNERINLGNAHFKASVNSTPNFRYTLTHTFQPSGA